MKIEPKDVKKYLSLKGKVVVTGKYASSLTKDWFIKFARGCKKVASATIGAVVGMATTVKDKIVDSATSTMDKIKTAVLPSEEVIQAKLEETREKKLEKIDDKRQALETLKTEIEKDDETKIELKNCYLKQVDKEIEKLNKKTIKVSNKGLGVFALTKLTLEKIKGNLKNKWANYLEKRAEKKQAKKIEANKRILEDNLKEQLRIQEENKAILAEYPELESFFQETYEEQYNKKNTESTRKTL